MSESAQANASLSVASGLIASACILATPIMIPRVVKIAKSIKKFPKSPERVLFENGI